MTDSEPTTSATVHVAGAGLDVADLSQRTLEDAGSPWVTMTDQLRIFLDSVAELRLTDDPADSGTLAGLTQSLREWNEHLAPLAGTEADRTFGRLDAHGRAQTMTPRLVLDHVDTRSASGTVRFGPYYLGGNGAVHGGAIPLMFDEILGRLSNTGGRAVGRTAYLKTDYRSITPIGADLQVRAWFVSEEGRKRLLRADLRHGGVLCAEAEGLFVALRPGQP